MLDNIRIVLVRPFHPGNIGSAARSMKTMGLSDLCLVNPRDYPNQEANKMAASAEDILAQAKIKQDLGEAIKDCTAIVASTARPRGYDLPELNPKQAAQLLIEHAQSDKVALLFGPERMGLHNDDIRLAKYRVTIPANPDYDSLNMAAAVQILCYEIYKAQLIPTKTGDKPQALPTFEEIECLYQHAETTFKQIGFLRTHQGESMLRIRHLLSKAQPTAAEITLLRGILNRINKSIKS